MRDLNKVQLMGRLGGDPELRFTVGGQPVANFSLATNNRYTTSAGEVVDDVQWHRVVIWGKLAQVVSERLKVGNRVYVDGRLQYRKWTDKETGAARVSTEIVVDELIFLGAPVAVPVNGHREVEEPI